MTSPGTRPVTVRVHRAERVVDITFDDGAAYQLPAEFLRVESPSAEVQGHGGPKQLVPGKVGVGITAVEPVGHYAIRICFDDGHDSGIYSWNYLRELGESQAALWKDYLQALQEAGLSREP